MIEILILITNITPREVIKGEVTIILFIDW